MSKSLYETLGVSSDTSSAEIKKAYRRLARKYHPDVNKDKSAEDKFKEINAAYEILSDTEKKAKYDQYGDQMFGGDSFHDFSRSQGGGSNFDDIIKNIFSGGGFGGGGFNTGGFGGGGFSGFEQPNLDVEVSLSIDFNSMLLGGKQTFNYNSEDITIKIPKGIKQGEKLRVKGKGNKSQGRAGDLYIQINITPSSIYKLDGDNLIQTKDVPLYDMLFGGKIEVDTPEKKVTLKIPANAKPGQKMRLKEYGVENRKTKVKGNLIVVLNVVLPSLDNVSEEDLAILKDKLPKE
ncbi:MAG: DnaJ-class molecular chaperone CbpA [uncultured Campylobacterales bacterium]|uniref:DnaJ-class molecular chaperone CbpA n=1 Tax=uncultured Campylobacterales bacterium TaxID=352960 RepID=A0A6S6SZK8_9BACT|nr:MAG: DnaJ-class molecular chaperone CbpA [uncultured Campylobacterales bacterium]